MSWWVPSAVVGWWCLLSTLLLQLPPFMEECSHVVQERRWECLDAAASSPIGEPSWLSHFFAQLQGRSPWSSPFIKDVWVRPVSLPKAEHKPVV